MRKQRKGWLNTLAMKRRSSGSGVLTLKTKETARDTPRPRLREIRYVERVAGHLSATLVEAGLELLELSRVEVAQQGLADVGVGEGLLRTVL